MAKAPTPLTLLSEAQRAEAYARFELLRPILEEGVSQAQIVRTHQLSKSAVQRWVKRYREQGLAGLVTTERKDKGKARTLPDQAITLVQGLALQTPPRSAAAIHRQVVEIATKPHSDDFTDKEAVATIMRITRGNLRLIDRLMLQVEHVLLANKIQLVTKEVVETARQNLIIGPG